MGSVPLEDRICEMSDGLCGNSFQSHLFSKLICSRRRITFYFHCSLYKNIRDPFLHHVGSTILNINEMNEIDKIKMFMSK